MLKYSSKCIDYNSSPLGDTFAPVQSEDPYEKCFILFCYYYSYFLGSQQYLGQWKGKDMLLSYTLKDFPDCHLQLYGIAACLGDAVFNDDALGTNPRELNRYIVRDNTTIKFYSKSIT